MFQIISRLCNQTRVTQPWIKVVFCTYQTTLRPFEARAPVSYSQNQKTKAVTSLNGVLSGQDEKRLHRNRAMIGDNCIFGFPKRFSTMPQRKDMNRERKKILILGAGLTSGPVIEYLSGKDEFIVTVVSRTKAALDDTKDLYPRVDILQHDVSEDDDKVDILVKNNDIVVSLVPSDLQAKIARICITQRRHMVHNTYLCPEVKGLHQEAQEAGITILTEIGLCPGIDHMLAKKCFDEIHSKSGRITSFISWCGGLPAPECTNVPLLQKFSWNPLAIMKACSQHAKVRREGKIIEIPGEGLLDNVEELFFFPGLNLEGFFNRNALTYVSDWGIKEARTIIRGRIRYKGFSDHVQGLVALNLLSPDRHPKLDPKGPDITWRSYLRDILETSPETPSYTLRSLVYDRVGKSDNRLGAIIDLGLLDDILVEKKVTPLDTISHYLAKKLSFQPNERDMIMLHNIIDIQWPDDSCERHTANVTMYGDYNGHSAMAVTTGLPTALAAEIILKGEYKEKGVQLPVSPDIYRPILSRLKLEGIIAKEDRHKL